MSSKGRNGRGGIIVISSDEKNYIERVIIARHYMNYVRSVIIFYFFAASSHFCFNILSSAWEEMKK